jgi:hypothetical protein
LKLLPRSMLLFVIKPELSDDLTPRWQKVSGKVIKRFLEKAGKIWLLIHTGKSIGNWFACGIWKRKTYYLNWQVWVKTIFRQNDEHVSRVLIQEIKMTELKVMDSFKKSFKDYVEDKFYGINKIFWFIFIFSTMKIFMGYGIFSQNSYVAILILMN